MSLDILIIILGVSIILLAVQIAAVLRINKLLRYLKIILKELGIPITRPKKKAETAVSHLHKCQYCKYRRTYIKASLNDESDDFYYRCYLQNRSVSLDHSCEKFEFESSL